MLVCSDFIGVPKAGTWRKRFLKNKVPGPSSALRLSRNWPQNLIITFSHYLNPYFLSHIAYNPPYRRAGIISFHILTILSSCLPTDSRANCRGTNGQFSSISILFSVYGRLIPQLQHLINVFNINNVKIQLYACLDFIIFTMFVNRFRPDMSLSTAVSRVSIPTLPY